MTRYQEWKQLAENQTEESFEGFWKTYSETETRIYSGLLSEKDQTLRGTLDQLTKDYQADPAIFMGFLDGIQDSLEEPFSLEALTEESALVISPNLEKLYYNMLAAGADYLYTLPQWDDLLSDEKKASLLKTFKKSKTVVSGEKIGRNDPCPCGSGKKYKHCCGK